MSLRNQTIPRLGIDELEHNAAQAMSAQDWKTLHSLEWADLQTVDSDGNWFKAAEEAKRDEENLKVTSTITNLDVRVYGNATVAIYDNEIKGTYKDRYVSAPTVATDVSVRPGKGWKMVSVQVTKKASRLSDTRTTSRVCEVAALAAILLRSLLYGKSCFHI